MVRRRRARGEVRGVGMAPLSLTDSHMLRNHRPPTGWRMVARRGRTVHQENSHPSPLLLPHLTPVLQPSPFHRSAHGGKAGARSAPGSSRGRASAVRLSGESSLNAEPLEAGLGWVRGSRARQGRAVHRAAPGAAPQRNASQVSQAKIRLNVKGSGLSTFGYACSSSKQ